jgi:hypothetical protein
MADTDLPQMPSYGTNSSPLDPRKRAIASPFGMFPPPAAPVPGLSMGPQADQAPSLMDSLWASLSSADNWKHATAEALGGPVDMAAWTLHKMGVPIPQAPTNTPYMGEGRGPWAAAASVPLGSQNILGMIDNPPNLSLMLQAMRRRGLF